MLAEMIVEYQLFAKSQCDTNLAVVAYGNGFLKYVPTDEIFVQSSYELSTGVCEIAPGIQTLINDDIAEMLAT